MKTDFHNKNDAQSLVFIMRLKATWKWPIQTLDFYFLFHLMAYITQLAERFFLASLLACTMSFMSLVFGVVGLFMSRGT